MPLPDAAASRGRCPARTRARREAVVRSAERAGGATAPAAHTYGERFALLKSTDEGVLTRIAALRGTLAVLDRKIGFYAQDGTAADTA